MYIILPELLGFWYLRSHKVYVINSRSGLSSEGELYEADFFYSLVRAAMEECYQWRYGGYQKHEPCLMQA